MIFVLTDSITYFR